MAGFLMLLAMDGVSGDMTIHANGIDLPIGPQSLENLLDCWMPTGKASVAVAELFRAGIVTMSNGRISVPQYEKYVRTENESTSRVRACRERKRQMKISGKDEVASLHCHAWHVADETQEALHSNELKHCNVIGLPLHGNEASQKEKSDKRKNIFEFGERGESSPSSPCTSDSSDECSTSCDGMAECDSEPDATREDSCGTDVELEADETASVASAKDFSMLREQSLCSMAANRAGLPWHDPSVTTSSEERHARQEDMARCGAEDGDQRDVLDSVDTELQTKDAAIVPARGKSAGLRERSLSSMADFSSRSPRMDPRELLRTGSLSFTAKSILEAFASKCPGLEMKASTTAEILNAQVAEALKTLSPHDLLRVFELAESSDFLTGRDGKMNSAPVTLDWLLQPDICKRILRGEFGVRGSKTPERRDAYAITFIN